MFQRAKLLQEGMEKGMMDKEAAEKIGKVATGLGEMLALAFQAFRKLTEESLREVEKAKKKVGQSSTELTEFLIAKASEDEKGREWARPFLSMASSCDRMAYNIEGIVYQLKMMVLEDIPFSDRAVKEVNTIFQEAMDLLGSLPDLILTGNRLLARHIGERGKTVFKTSDGYAEEHEKRLIEGVCMPKSSPIYLGILESLKGVIAHILEISGKIDSVSSKS